MVPVNYLAVLASTIVMMALGSLWYGPLFGKQWMALMGFDPARIADMQAKGAAAMWKSYAIMALGALLMSYVLQHALIFATAYLGTTGVGGGFQVGFWNWLGFVAPVMVGSVIWEGKPWKLFIINAGYYLVGLLIIGALQAMWL